MFIGISEYKISIFFRKVFVDNIEINIHYRVIFTISDRHDRQTKRLRDRYILTRRAVELTVVDPSLKFNK